jgi:hypothetical protein
VVAVLQLSDDFGGLLGSQAVQVQMLMPRAVNSGQAAAGGLELGLQFGDRLPQGHRVGVHRARRVFGHDRPVMLCCV